MIKICDAIMGSGKSSAAIRYMNENCTEKFIYITPYIKEADRIQRACPHCHFARPSDNIPDFGFSICGHTAALIKDGRNIATTHAAFKFYSKDMLQDIKDQGYILLVDENIEMMEEMKMNTGDLDMCIRAGYVKRENNEIVLLRDDYNGRVKELKQFFGLLRSRNLMCLSDADSGLLYYWMLTPDLFTSFKDIIIMTYMFDGQEIHHFLKLNNLEYTFIRVDRDELGYFFTTGAGYVPEYTRTLHEKIRVLDNEKLNAIGKHVNALSYSWCERSKGSASIMQLKNNIYNFFRNYAKSPASERMWGSFSKAKNKLRGEGYAKAFVSFNERATNEYSSRHVLVYAVNVYMNVPKKLYFQSRGIDVNEDIYALSTMVQWIWRSAIRNGEDIDIYIPSKRMRNLLINWMDELARGGAAK